MLATKWKVDRKKVEHQKEGGKKRMYGNKPKDR
jgi:hypothetical protein